MDRGVDGGTPRTFDAIVDLIRSSKPPLACRVVELRDGEELRSARVIFDGIAGSLIETEKRTEFRHADDFVLLDEEGTLRCFGPGLVAHSNAWVKTPIEGRRMSLDQASGRVFGREVVAGRPSVRAEIEGLRSGEDVVFQFHIDLETGVVLRMARADLGLVMRLEDLRIGNIEEGP